MRFFILVAFGLVLSGCSDESGDGLPSTFGDCGESVCEVSLEAFTAEPGVIPYCDDSLSLAVSASCTDPSGVESGSCDGVRVLRRTYGPPGDSYSCVYDDSTGDLVGALWQPDNHPTQRAGVSAPTSCALSAISCADGGA